MRIRVLPFLLAGAAALVAGPAKAPAGSRMHAYAPPTIPHPVDKSAACTDCHGQEISGGVPAIPHRTAGFCPSCHLAQQPAKSFRPNTFKQAPPGPARGTRATPGAPPGVPHPVFMRENCQACHGRTVHPGMGRNPHPERAHCLSCHLSEKPV